MSSPPPLLPATRSPTNHMFNEMQYSTINGGEFYNVGHDLVRNFHTTSTVASPHKTLWGAIAGVGASYNSALQFDRGSCLPGTREAVLRDIHEWSASTSDSSPICWLSGTAGVGKSAIALTAAKSCAENNRLAASFFFFRSDPKRNNPSSLMLTIAHGLVTTIPSLRPIIHEKIATDPRILEANLEDQFRELVVLPLLNVSLPSNVSSSLIVNPPLTGPPSSNVSPPLTVSPSSNVSSSLIVRPSLNSSPSSKRRSWIPRWGQRWRRHVPEQPLPQLVPQSVQQPESLPQSPAQKDPNLVIIDGLDECKDSDTQLRLISILTSAYQQSPHFPLRLLICSRPEAWIREAFDLPNHCILTKHIKLDDSYLPNQDIERYFRSEFTSIHRNTKYSQVEFPNPWPSEADIQRLVENASAQFIYATTAMKVVKAEFSHPIAQLHIILESRSNRISPKSPFPELDNLYYIIVSVNPEQDKLLSILSAILLLPEKAKTPKFIELLLGFSHGEVDLSLRGMHSVLDIRGARDDIRVYHTSFTDYLCTKSRSAEFYIDEPRQRDFLACRWLTALGESCKAQAKSFHSVEILLAGLGNFFSSVKQPSEQLLYELGSLDLPSLIVATGVNLQVESWMRESCKRWALLFRCFRTITSWLNREGVDPDIIKCFVDIQDCIQVNPSLDEETQSDLENWVIFNVTGCSDKCPLAERVDASVAKLFACVRNSESSSGPLSLAGPTSTPSTSIDIPSGCFRTVKCLCYDLETSMARFQKLGPANKHLGKFRFKGTVYNLLESTLLESSVPQPELLSILRTISETVKMYSEITQKHLRIPQEREDKLLSWCESLPDGYAECTDLVKNQILPFIDFRF